MYAADNLNRQHSQTQCNFVVQFLFVCLFDLILHVPSTIFQLNRDGSSWIEPVLSYDKCILLKDHNAVTPVRLKPAVFRSRVKHSTTEPLRSLIQFLISIIYGTCFCICFSIRQPHPHPLTLLCSISNNLSWRHFYVPILWKCITCIVVFTGKSYSQYAKEGSKFKVSELFYI